MDHDDGRDTVSTVAVVTDSTADLPAEMVRELGLRVVPMTVAFGDEEYISRLTISDEEFYARLRAGGSLPTTSQPVPAWFEEAYADAADQGAGGVVSVHISSRLSGTCDVARSLAASAPLPVEVVDSRQVSGGLALAVLAARNTAETGADRAGVAAAARATAAAAQVFFVVDSLDHLRRGGRLSGAQAAVGTVLRFKPILTVRDGEVTVLERARTWSRATTRLVELATDHAGGSPVDVVVCHAQAPARAAELAVRMRDAAPVRTSMTTVVGPVVGAHCGAGTLGVAVAPAT